MIVASLILTDGAGDGLDAWQPLVDEVVGLMRERMEARGGVEKVCTSVGQRFSFAVACAGAALIAESSRLHDQENEALREEERK